MKRRCAATSAQVEIGDEGLLALAHGSGQQARRSVRR